MILEDGTDVNEILVREGLARISARLPLMRLDELRRAEAEAQSYRRGMWGAATQACALVGAAAGVWIGAHRVELEELGGTRLRLTLSGWSGLLVGGFIGRVVASLWGQRLLDVMHVHAGGATVTDIELVIVLVAYGCATLVGAVAKERRVVA